MPSGISAAMTAISASNHRQYVTYFGYSALHSSDKCLPAHQNNKSKTKLIILKNYIN